MNLIVKAIGGSKLYGIDTPRSDTDLRGVFIPNLYELLIDKIETVEEDPDTVYHSLEKFTRLCLNGNPSALELLFTPESHILESTKDWKYLVHIRNEFLSKRVLKAYGGFLKHQVADCRRKEDRKALVHAYRLADQLSYICVHDTLNPVLDTIAVKNVQRIYEGDYDLEILLHSIEATLKLCDVICTLPDEPNTQRIHECMIKLYEWSYRV